MLNEWTREGSIVDKKSINLAVSSSSISSCDGERHVAKIIVNSEVLILSNSSCFF